MSTRRPASPRGYVVPVDGDWSHGTHYAYDKIGCRCEDCRDAGRQAKQEKMARAATRRPTTHGLGTYVTYRCRCAECRQAWSRYHVKWKQRINTASRDSAAHHYEEWTGAELEVAARADLTARQVGEMLGRTMLAVNTMRALIRRPGTRIERVLTATHGD